jgi:hypothetical protein
MHVQKVKLLDKFLTCVKLKLSVYKPRFAARTSGGSGCQDIQPICTRRYKNLSAQRTGRLSHQGMSLLLVSARGWVDRSATVRPVGLSQQKISKGPFGNFLICFSLRGCCVLLSFFVLLYYTHTTQNPHPKRDFFSFFRSVLFIHCAPWYPLSSCHLFLYNTQHKHAWPRRNPNPHSQQASDSRP